MGDPKRTSSAFLSLHGTTLRLTSNGGWFSSEGTLDSPSNALQGRDAQAPIIGYSKEETTGDYGYPNKEAISDSSKKPQRAPRNPARPALEVEHVTRTVT